MCLRYSSSVVAPTQRSSPRASSGFSRFAASTAPSAAPAPTIVCSSSMKRMTRPSELLISASTAFSRSSNSPRYFAPASSEPMSSAQTLRSFESLGHVAGDDPLREPLGDRGLADARLADQHRVVLRAAREDLDHATDLLVAADHGIELALLGGLGQVAAELRERLVGALGILRRDALPAADRLDPRLDLGARHGLEREEEMLGRDVVVAHQLAFLVRAVEHARERRGRVRLLLAALHGRQRRHLALGVGAQRLPVGEELLVEQRQQQVLGGQLGVAAAPRRVLRGSDRLLALDCQLVEVHVPFMPVLDVKRTSQWLPPDVSRRRLSIRGAAPGVAGAGRARGRGGRSGAPRRARGASPAPSARGGGACAAARPPSRARARRPRG